MTNATVILSLLSMVGFIAAAVVLAVRSDRIQLGIDVKAPLFLALFFYGFIVASNFLEHSGITDFFDPLEDVVEIVFTLVLLFFAHNWRKQKSFDIIRDQKIWLRSTLASIADGIITTDRDGNVLLMNQAMEQLTGWSLKEALGKNTVQLLDFLGKKNRVPVAYNPFQQVLQGRTGQPPHGVLLRSRDGSERPVADSTSLILGPDNDILGAVGIFRDMTEYESLTEQLAHTHKMEAIGQLSGGVAHDLNNMIGGIMGAADVMHNRLAKEENSRYDKLLSIIRGAADNARDLTANLLAFSRKNKLFSTPISVKEVVEKTAALAKRTIDKRITLETVSVPDACMVVGEPSQLQNALLNLVLNACDAMPDGGSVTISLEVTRLDDRFCAGSAFDISPGPYAALSVKDTGTGISRENQARIFDPFFTTKEEGKGTGLGLSAVYQTLVKHHGAISLESAPGKGTAFTLYLPSADTAVAEETADLPGDGQHMGCILLIEDEAMLRSSTKMMLEDAGFCLFTAESGEKGIEVYNGHREDIDVVLLDMVMPGMTGLEVFSTLWQTDDRVKVIFTSGLSREDVLPETAAGFVKKPFKRSELVAVIERVIARAPPGCRN